MPPFHLRLSRPTTTLLLRPLRPLSTTTVASRSLHLSHTPPLFYAQKDSMDKDSLVPRTTEHAQTGGNDDAAQSDAAFDPGTTRPEEQEDMARKEAGGSESDNPLNVSGANPKVSQPRSGTEGGAETSATESSSDSASRARTSGGGSPKKHGGDKSGGGPA